MSGIKPIPRSSALLGANTAYLRQHGVVNNRLVRAFRDSRLPAYLVYFDRKSTINAVVALGFSSMIQWPEPGTIPIVTFVATKRRVSASLVPNDFSAPKASTGIASLPPAASNALLSRAS